MTIMPPLPLPVHAGVSESIVTFARKQQVGMIVVGSRGMGSIKR